jgi:hypothetical protein
VYDASEGKGWIWDITVDRDNHPVMVFASFPSDVDHRYHYARWTGTEWYLTELTGAGRWFPQTPAGTVEREPNYSGGITLDYDDPSVVYLSRQMKGVFEVFRYSTRDKGVTWDSTALTWDTPAGLVNVRPVVPRHHRHGIFDLIWMRGTYVHYTDFHTSLLYWSDTLISRVDGGNIQGMSIGTATVTAKAFNGKTAQCVVNVTAGRVDPGEQRPVDGSL